MRSRQPAAWERSVLPTPGVVWTVRGVANVDSNPPSRLQSSTSLISNSQGHSFPVTNNLSSAAS